MPWINAYIGPSTAYTTLPNSSTPVIALDVDNNPAAKVPQIPFAKWTATAPTGSSIWNLLSRTSTTTTTRIPETIPTIVAPIISRLAHPAVIPTKPAKPAFRHIDTSGFLFLTHVNINVVHVATAGATVVVAKIIPSWVKFVAAAPLNPYQPNQRMKQPSAPKVIEWPWIAFTFVTFPSLSFVYLPRRGPSIIAPIKAAIPPTEWIAALPAKSINPSWASHPPPHTQWASIG